MEINDMARKLFVKGQSGNPSGLKKDGTPARKSARLKVQEILEMEDFSPFHEMINLFRETKKERVKADILIELCSYVAPKLKHVEVSSDETNPFIINLQLKPGKKKITEPDVKKLDAVMEGLHDEITEE